MDVNTLKSGLGPQGAGKYLCSCSLGVFNLKFRPPEETYTLDNVRSLKATLLARQSRQRSAYYLARADERCARHRDEDLVATKMSIDDWTNCNSGRICVDRH